MRVCVCVFQNVSVNEAQLGKGGRWVNEPSESLWMFICVYMCYAFYFSRSKLTEFPLSSTWYTLLALYVLSLMCLCVHTCVSFCKMTVSNCMKEPYCIYYSVSIPFFAFSFFCLLFYSLALCAVLNLTTEKVTGLFRSKREGEGGLGDKRQV